MRRYLIAALALLPALASPARAGTPAPGFTDSSVVGGLSSPTAIAFLPDGKLLIAQKGGALKFFDGTNTTLLVTIPVCTSSEMGLLGVAIDPNFASNGFIYLYRTKAGSGGCGTSTGRFNQVVRVTMSGGSVNISSLTELLSGIATDGGNHDGGVLRIGPDQKLWVGVGDTGVGDNVGGPGSSTNPYAQDLASLNGKILRLNLDGSAPADNPFVATSGARGEIWAYGFRNPFRMSFDSATGKLWIADVGDLTVEEINIGVASGNYSWPRCEGNLQGPSNAPQPCVVGTDIAPVFTYPHSGSTSLGDCVIGGAFAGSAFGSMAGDYVFGDCTSSNVYRVALNAARNGFAGTPEQVSTGAGTPADFIPGPDGAIYYAAVSAGEVRRLATTAQQASQTITVTQGAPAAAVFDATFPVAATASSGLPVAIGISGVCSISNGTVTMTSGTGTCTVTFDQAGNANYAAAPQVVQATAAQQASQTITVTQAAPATAPVNTTFPVAATASSGLPVAIGASGVCSINNGTVTMTSGTGTCTVTFDQAGNANYAAAPQVVQTTTATPAAPAITGFTPTRGTVGKKVTINGSNFTGATSVSFHGTAATFTVNSATKVTALVPVGATTGPITVTTAGGTATSAASFVVGPAITSFSPPSGGVGASVAITGANFTGATAVKFNGKAAAFIVDSASQITATVPVNATTGPITVTTPAGTGKSATNFTVAPAITSFTPTSGAVGTKVTITGSNLTGALAVDFHGTAASFTVNSATRITATVPGGATTGPISVTTPGGTATSAINFTVVP